LGWPFRSLGILSCLLPAFLVGEKAGQLSVRNELLNELPQCYGRIYPVAIRAMIGAILVRIIQVWRSHDRRRLLIRQVLFDFHADLPWCGVKWRPSVFLKSLRCLSFSCILHVPALLLLLSSPIIYFAHSRALDLSERLEHFLLI